MIHIPLFYLFRVNDSFLQNLNQIAPLRRMDAFTMHCV